MHKLKYQMIIQNKATQHVLFWIASFIVLLNVLKVSASPQKIDIIYTFFFQLPLILAVYVNGLLIIPRVLSKKRYLVYAFWLAFILSLGSLFYLQLFESWIDIILPDYFFIAYYTFWDYILFLAGYVFVSTLLKLAKSWFRLLEVEKENKSNSLKLLQKQLNPHFLFNTLNIIYGMAIKQTKELPEVIIKLSDLMRYSLYDSEKATVPLEDEIKFLENYVDLQKQRLSQPDKINLHIIGQGQKLSIAPMLMTPFVENAFKHHGDSRSTSFFIHIQLEQRNLELIFTCKNSVIEKADKPNPPGIGIENTKNRLALLYPNAHHLSLNFTKDQYCVTLKLKTAHP